MRFKGVFVPFGEYLPDLPALNNPGSQNIRNVIPASDMSYLSIQDISTLTSALTAKCRGAFSVRHSDATPYTFAGDAAKLYELTSASSSWTDRSGATYTLSTEENWAFTKFGGKVIAGNINDDPQIITVGAGTAFAALAGTPPKARHWATIREFVVCGNLDEAGTLNPIKVRWCGINDETAWTASATTLSASKQLNASSQYGGGWIQGIRGGEYGIIWQEFSIWRMSFAGSPTVWQFDEVLPGYGCASPSSIVHYGNMSFYLGQEGFDLLLNGVERVPIGANKVDKTFLNDVDADYFYNIVGAIDPKNRVVMWIYPGSGHSGGLPNKYLAFNWVTRRWAAGDIDCEWIFSGLGSGYTLEGLDAISADIDALPASLDSRLYNEGAIRLGAFDTDHKMGGFLGSTLPATLETGEKEFNPQGRTLLHSARPQVEGQSVAVTCASVSRNLQTDAATTGSAESVHAETGLAHMRKDARFHRVQCVTSGDFDHAMGVTCNIAVTGSR